MDSDLDEELLGIAESKPGRSDRPTKKRTASSSSAGKQEAKRRRAEIDPDETEDEDLGGASGPASRALSESSAQEDAADQDNADDDDDDDGEEDMDMDMDLDIESEDGYDASTRPAIRPHASGSSSHPEKTSESAARPGLNHAPSSKDKKTKSETRKVKEKPRPKPRAKKAAAPAVKKPSAKSKAKDSKKSSSGPIALYPLEGKYKDAEDREYLDQLPEIEREEILAARLEEQQREIDRQALGDLYKQTVGKDVESDEDEDAEGEEEDMDIDEDDEDEPPKKHVESNESDAEEPKRKLGRKDVTSSAISALKERRQAKTDRSTNKVDKPAPGRRLDSDSESEGPSSEEGEVRRRNRRRQDYGDDDDEAYMGDEGTFGKSRSRPRDDEADAEKVELPVTPEDLNGVRLSRWELVDIKHRSFFRDMVVGAYVKCSAGVDPNQQLKYRIFEVVGVEPEGATYRIEYKGKEIPDNRKLLLRYGNVNKPYKMSDVSNKDFDHREFIRWQETTKADKVDMPRKSRLRAKHAQLKKYRDMPVTEQDIKNRLEALHALGHMSSTSAALQRQRLVSELELAKRSDDQAWEARAQQELDAFEESLAMSAPASHGGNGADEGAHALLAKVNEKNRREAAEAAKRAHRADQARRKLADQVGMLDPSARVKMKINKHDAGVPELLAKSLQELEQKKRNSISDGLVPQSATSATVVVIEADTDPSTPATPMRRLDAAIANAVDLDLGDF